MTEPIVCVPSANGQRAGGHGRRRAAARSTWRVRQVVGITGRTGLKIGKFGGDGFAGNQSAGLAQQRTDAASGPAKRSGGTRVPARVTKPST